MNRRDLPLPHKKIRCRERSTHQSGRQTAEEPSGLYLQPGHKVLWIGYLRTSVGESIRPAILRTDVSLCEPSDSQVLERLRRDGDQGLAAVFAQYRDRLERMVALRMDPRVRGRLDPADVLQEVYLDASKRLAAYVASPEAPVFVWLRGIAANTLTDLHRRHLGAQARDAKREVSIGLASGTTTAGWLAGQLVGSMTSPSQAAIREETAAQLAAAIDQMDELDREVLLLRHFELLRNHEVAMILNLSENAASNRYVRALARLRELVAAIPAVTSQTDWKAPL